MKLQATLRFSLNPVGIRRRTRTRNTVLNRGNDQAKSLRGNSEAIAKPSTVLFLAPRGTSGERTEERMPRSFCASCAIEPWNQRAADVSSAELPQNCRQDAGSTIRFMRGGNPTETRLLSPPVWPKPLRRGEGPTLSSICWRRGRANSGVATFATASPDEKQFSMNRAG
jgi:hypothetical protein